MTVLMLTHRLPYPPNRGDRMRAFHIVRLLAAVADVHLISLVQAPDEAAGARVLRSLGIQVSTCLVPRTASRIRAALALPGTTPLTHVLLHSPQLAGAIAAACASRPPDVVVAYGTGIAPFAATGPLAGVPMILDMVDVDSAKWARLAGVSGPVTRWIYRRESRLLGGFERAIAERAIATVVVSERERQALERICPDARTHVVPVGVDVAHLLPPEAPAQEPRVIFTGVFDYLPNVHGARWLAREVWPIVAEAVPAARLVLAGAHPVRAVRRLARANASIQVTGAVDDMRPHLWASAVAVAPLHHTGGVQTKVLEAVAAGLPCVITPQVRDGLPAGVLPACEVAATPEAFASALVSLLGLPSRDRRLRAQRAAVETLDAARQLAPLVSLVLEAGTRRVPLATGRTQR